MDAIQEAPKKKGMSPILIVVIVIVALCLLGLCCVFAVPALLALMGPAIGNVFSTVITQIGTPAP
jgi:hypothetical protein